MAKPIKNKEMIVDITTVKTVNLMFKGVTYPNIMLTAAWEGMIKIETETGEYLILEEMDNLNDTLQVCRVIKGSPDFIEKLNNPPAPPTEPGASGQTDLTGVDGEN